MCHFFAPRARRRYIFIFPVHHSPGAGSAHLQAGPAVKHNQDILAQSPGLFLLAFAQTFARRHHQDD